MRFQPRSRPGRGGGHALMAAAEPAQRVQPTMRPVRITRIVDPAGADPDGVHIFPYSAVRPTDAELGCMAVYNGKVLAKVDSRDRAMTHAVERHRGPARPGYQGTYDEVRNGHPEAHVMDPAAMRAGQREPFGTDLSLDWVDAWDLLDDCPAIVPANFVLCPFRGPSHDTWVLAAHGLASGGSIEEAAVRGLTELIERDAYAIAVGAARAGRMAGADGALCPLIDLATVPGKVHELISSAERDGTQVWLRDLTSDIGIPTLAGYLRAPRPDGTVLVAGGFGCAADPVAAAAHALTEARNCRHAVLQGLSEEFITVTVAAPGEQALWRRDGAPAVPFPQTPAHRTHPGSCLPGGLDVLIGQLKAVGMRDAYAVDLTDPEIPASAARVIVPELASSPLADAAPRARLRERSSHGSLPSEYRVIPRPLECNVHA